MNTRSSTDSSLDTAAIAPPMGELTYDKAPTNHLASPAYSPMKPLSLRTNFSWTFVGNLVYAGCQWGMLTVLAKLGTPEMVGQFALGLAVTAPIITFFNLNLGAVQVTDVKHQYRFSDYLILRVIMTLAATIIIMGVIFLSNYRWETGLIVLAVGVAKATEAISDVFFSLLQQNERMDRIAKSMLIKGPLSLIALTAGVALTHSVLWGAVGLIITSILMLMFYDMPNGTAILRHTSLQATRGTQPGKYSGEYRPQFDLKVLLRLIWLALPLGFVMLLVSLNSNIPRYFVERHFGEYQLGIFVAIAYIERASDTISNALGQSASPRLAKYYAAGNVRAYKSLLFKLIGVGIVMGLVGIFAVMIAGRQILTLLYKAEYAQTSLFLILTVASSLGDIASFLGYSMTAARYFSVQLPLFILITAISFIACWFLVPTMGLYGAALALIIVVVVRILASSVVIIHAMRKLSASSVTQSQ